MDDNIVYIKRDESDQTNNGHGNAINTITPKLWILIEYRVLHPNSKIPVKNYEVVDVKDVCGAGGRGSTRLESMHTGKIIYVRKDTLLVQATIVTISDDKAFLDTELKDLMELSKSENHPKKRRRTVTPKLPTSPTSPSERQMVPLYQRFNSHESANGVSNQSSVIISNPNVQNCPPMTFDQQTQTDTKLTNYENPANDVRFQKIIANEETMLRQQHNLSAENQELKQKINNLSTEMTEVKSMLTEILAKMDYTRQMNKRKIDENNSIIVGIADTNSATKTESVGGIRNPPRILNLSHSTAVSNPQFYNSISIEPIDASNDSNFSFSNNSRMSLSASNMSLYHNANDSNVSASTHNNSNSSNREYTIAQHTQSMDGFHDDEGNGDDEVVIGNNNTTVPRNLLTNINWNSHTAATRRLLRAKFSREVLATHSLTGKPSPGELNFMEKCFSDPQVCDFRINKSLLGHLFVKQLLWSSG